MSEREPHYVPLFEARDKQDRLFLILHRDGTIELPGDFSHEERVRQFFDALRGYAHILRADGFRAGQEDMRRRAVEVAEQKGKWSGTNAMSIVGSRIATAIASLEIKDECARNNWPEVFSVAPELADDAAAEIERLRAENARCRQIAQERLDALVELDARLAEAVEVVRAINRRASPDPARTFDDAIRDLEHVTALARAFLAKMGEKP